VSTTFQLATEKRSANPLVLWHLLSLDAPTVAALWTWFIARDCHLRLPFVSIACMALAVWILYASDRLLDTRSLSAPPLQDSRLAELEARHWFHHRHRAVFLAGILLAAILLAALLPSLSATALHLYLVEGTLLAAWFLVLHATHSAHRLPKETAVGLFFATAVFIPTVSRGPLAGASTPQLALLPMAVLLAALCSLNCLFIYAWEHEYDRRPQPLPPHATTRFAIRHLPAIGLSIASVGAALALLPSTMPRAIPAACSLSALLLLVLHRKRHRLSTETLRASADLVLLTPLALLPFVR
jgi:hypothetical protein